MKIRLLVSLAVLAISLAMPALAQDQNTVDPETRQEIEAVAMPFVEAYNKQDAAVIAALDMQLRYSGYLGMEWWKLARPHREDLCSSWT